MQSSSSAASGLRDVFIVGAVSLLAGTSAQPPGLRADPTPPNRSLRLVAVSRKQARTPVGSFQGALKQASAVELGVTAVKGVLSQAKVEPSQVEDLYFGQVLQAGAGQSPARQVVIGAGMPETTEATTINKVRAHAPALKRAEPQGPCSREC